MFRTKEMPRHAAFIIEKEPRAKNLDTEELYRRMFSKVKWLMDVQTDHNIPLMTAYILPADVKNSEDFPVIIDKLVEFFEGLRNHQKIYWKKIKVSVLGKWYDLPGRAIDPIKAIIDETKDYDSFFLNLCVNYSGKEEIVDACRIIGRRIQAGKLDLDAIDKEVIKDNIYSSYFLPPDIMIKTGKEKKLHGFLLWDATESHIHFAGKSWLRLNEKDIKKAIEEWRGDNG